MRTDLTPFRKSGLANCFGRQQNRSKEGFQCWLPRAIAHDGRPGPRNQSYGLTPNFHTAATRRRSFPNDSAVYACSARSARRHCVQRDRRDRAPLSSRRPVPYPRGKESDRRGDARVGSPRDLKGALCEIGSRLVADGDRVSPFDPCEDKGPRNRPRFRTSLQSHRERAQRICQGAVPLALADLSARSRVGFGRWTRQRQRGGNQ